MFYLVVIVHVQTLKIKVPPFHSPVRLAEPEPGSAPHCSGEWLTPLPPESQSAQTQTVDANLEDNVQIYQEERVLNLHV